jgi:uncharacterized MnhB-related membrane protein
MSADLDQNVAGKNFLIVDLWRQIPKALFAVIRALRSAAAQLFSIARAPDIAITSVCLGI